MRRLQSRRAWLKGGVAWAALSAWTAGSAQALQPWPLAVTPALEAVDLNGRRWRLDELKGRAVVLNFWATWCPPCLHEMPGLQQLADFYDPQSLVVLAVNVKEPPSRIRRFVQSTGLRLPVLLDPQGSLALAWGVKIFPSTVLIDARGQPRHWVKGEVDWSAPEALGWIDRLLAR